MKRVFVGLVCSLPLALAVASCDDGSWGAGGYGYGYGSAAATCGSYDSCGTCTPIEGCGWCAAPNGSGVCASDPDDCPTLEFTWTWNPSGCRVAADATVETPDGSTGDAPSHVTDGSNTTDVESDGSSSGSGPEGGCVRQADGGVADAPNCD
jgi:hypothetical protein